MTISEWMLGTTYNEEVSLTFFEPHQGKIYFNAIKNSDKNWTLKNGFLRLSFEFVGISKKSFSDVAVINLVSGESLEGAQWICNSEHTIIQGNKNCVGNSVTIPLEKSQFINSKKQKCTRLVLHIEFGKVAQIISRLSYFSFFNKR